MRPFERPPPDRPGILPEAEAWLGRWIGRLANLLAIVGGVMLAVVAVVAVVSIMGRALLRSGLPVFAGLGPVPGDFEIVSMGSGIAIFAFLAWAQFNRGHVTVDILVSRLGPRGLAILSALTGLMMTVVAVVLARQLGLGLEDKRRFGETTAILQIPLWWVYAGGLAGLWSFALVSGYTVWRSLNEAMGAGEPGGREE